MSLNYVSQQTCEDIRTISKTQYVWLIQIKMHSGKKNHINTFPSNYNGLQQNTLFRSHLPPQNTLALKKKKKEGEKEDEKVILFLFTQTAVDTLT